MATTWAKTGTRSVKATCTTGSESAPAAPAKASGTATLVSVAAGDTLVLRGVTFTASATDNTGQNFLQTGDDTADAAALAAAINRYAAQTGCTATSATNVVTITASEYGVAGNAITLTETGTTITVSGATLASGVDVVGVALADVGSLSVKAEAVTAAQTIAGGSLKCYVLNGRSDRWLAYADGDLTPGTALQGYAWAFSVVSPIDYIAWVPSGVTISSGSMVIYLDAVEPDNRPASGRSL